MHDLIEKAGGVTLVTNIGELVSPFVSNFKRWRIGFLRLGCAAKGSG